MSRKLVNNRFDFEYESFDELLYDIWNLHREGYAITYGEQQLDGKWFLEAKKVNEYAIRNCSVSEYFAIYERFNGKIKYEGRNNIRNIFENNKREKTNIKDLDKAEKAKYIYRAEYLIDEKEIETIKRLNREELTNLIDFALETNMDKSWLKLLSQCFKEKY